MNAVPPVEVLITTPFPDALIAELRDVSPRLRITLQPARRPEDISTEVWNRTEVLFTDRILPDPALVPNLRWVQFFYAGIDFAVESPLFQKPDVVVSTLSGAAAAHMAEFAVTMMLACGHYLPALLANQAKAEWPRERWERFAPRELRGSTVGLIGYGSIGREIARLLQPWNCKILAVKRDVMQPVDTDYTPPGLGDPLGTLFTRLYPPQAIRSVLKECDFVVVCVPLSDATRSLIGAAELAVMKPGAYLIDIGRGHVVEPAALLEMLQERRIAGAALDVFPEEPLPPSSPFWRLSNAIITPHIGGISMHYNERCIAMFAENLRRYLAGSPVYNRFDPQRGY